MSDNNLTIDDLLELVKASRELAAEIDLPVVLEKILTTAGKLTSSFDGSVLLHNPSSICDGRQGSFYFASAIGEKASWLLRTKGAQAEVKDQVPMHSVSGEVFTTGRSVVKNDVAVDTAHNKTVDAEANFVTQSMICVPLSAAGEKLGVMQILNKQKGSYSERDQFVLEAFSSQAAVAIRNAKLFEDVLAHMGFPTSAYRKERTVDILQKLREPARREYMTLFMVDMRGFTELCNVINNPERIQIFLNGYFEFLHHEVIKHHGTVNKFLGDGLLAFFREENHERNAVQCAFAIANSFGAFVREWKKREKVGENIKFLDVGVGIVSDHVIVGSIGAM
ncbi:MAG: GAF domain-containing protein, partial [Capsulimonas sp.]|uniref:GAF domain-containing protein n=1 Tax=Capsulimonas sp. TaxID=2494211 RepID=UPI0032636C8A